MYYLWKIRWMMFCYIQSLETGLNVLVLIQRMTFYPYTTAQRERRELLPESVCSETPEEVGTDWFHKYFFIPASLENLS